MPIHCPPGNHRNTEIDFRLNTTTSCPTYLHISIIDALAHPCTVYSMTVSDLFSFPVTTMLKYMNSSMLKNELFLPKLPAAMVFCSCILPMGSDPDVLDIST